MQAVKNMVTSYFESHYRACVSALDDLKQKPFNTVITLLVIAITLTLPASLIVLSQNAQTLISKWDSRNQISLYLEEDITFHETNELARALEGQAGIVEVSILEPDKALKTFQKETGIQNIASALGKNPLPYSLILYLDPTLTTKNAEYLVNQLSTIPKIDVVQFDLLWLKRLEAIVNFSQQFMTIITVILSLAVFLIIGNTTRINLQNKKTTIEVTQLFGASKTYILRPFIYMGFWYGLISALISVSIILFGILLLNPSVKALATLYNSHFYLMPLNISNSFKLMTIAIILCITGTWLTGHRFLKNNDY